MSLGQIPTEELLRGVPSVGSVGDDGGGVASGLVESGRVAAVMSMALS